MDLDLRLGAPVYAAGERGERERVGTLTRVLVNDETDVVEEIVIRLDRGVEELLGDAPEVRAPVERVAGADERAVVLDASAAEVEALPEYLEERPPRPDEPWRPPPGYTVSDLLARLSLLLGAGAHAPPVIAEYERPAEERQILLHAPAVGGGERLGEITRVLFEAGSGRVRGLALRPQGEDDEVLVPADRVEAVGDDAVQVTLSRDDLARLERFQP